MMGDIYQNAERVLIWLGEAYDGSVSLESFIPRLLRAKELKDAAQDTRTYNELTRSEMEAYDVPPLIVAIFE
jgi:hypothetical protein